MTAHKLLWIVIYSLTGLLTYPSVAQISDVVFDYEAPLELTRWEYRWGDSPVAANDKPVWIANPDSSEWDVTDRLLGPDGEVASYLWFRKKLPDFLPTSGYIAVRYAWMEIEMYLDEDLFYRSGDMQFDYADRYEGGRFHLVELPEHAAGKMLYFRVSSGFGRLVGLAPDKVYVGNESSLVRYGIQKDLSSLIIGLVILDAGIVVFLLLLLSKRGQENRILLFYIGLFAVSYGLNYVSSHTLFYLLIQNVAVIYFLKTLFFLFPVGLLGLFQCIIGSGPGEIIKWMKYIHLVLWGGVLALDVFQVTAFFINTPLLFSTLAVSLIAMAFTVIPAIRKRQLDSKIMGIAILISIIPGLIDTIGQGILFSANLPALSPWGSLLCMFALAFLLDRRFGRNMTQLQSAHKLLEEHSSSLEQRVKQRTTELQEKNEKLQDTLDDLKRAQNQLVQAEKLASLGQLTAGIAHEIKNPLNFVNNFASLSIELADELADAVKADDDFELILEDLKTNAAHIAKHGERADRIVRSMMEHARSGAREMKPTKLNELVEEYVNLAFHGMRARKQAFNVQIIRNYDDRIGDLLIVPQEIGRVVINLCTNAFDAMREKMVTSDNKYQPILQVITVKNSAFAEVYIKDNGCGVPEQKKIKIFDPFFTTKPAGVGTGLGLSISYDIVVMGHNGQFELADTGAEGTEFVVRLPLLLK